MRGDAFVAWRLKVSGAVPFLLFCLMLFCPVLCSAMEDLKVDLLYPLGGETWAKGSFYTIRWQVRAGDPAEKIRVALNIGSKPALDWGGFAAGDGAFRFEVPLETPTSDEYSVSIINQFDTELARSGPFSIAARPVLKLRAPMGAENWVLGKAYFVAWESLGVKGYVSIELMKGKDVARRVDAVPVSQLRYRFVVPDSLAPGSDYSIRVRSLSRSDITLVSRPFKVLASARPTRKWTILAYQAADNDLQKSMLGSFAQMAQVGSNPDMNVVVQLDRKAVEPRTFGGWHDTKRFVVREGMTPTAANAIQDLGELNMSSKETLINFMNWATENFPAERYMLIISDHGYTYESGTARMDFPTEKGVLRDDGTDQRRGDRALAPTEVVKGVIRDDTNWGSMISPSQLAQALDAVPVKMTVIGMDACEQAWIENAYELRDSGARLFIAPQHMIAVVNGWAYDTLFAQMKESPSMTLTELGKAVCDTFIESCNQADECHGTMSAVLLSNMNKMGAAVTALGEAMKNTPGDADKVKKAAAVLETVLKNSIVAEAHTADFDGKHFGLNILFTQNGPVENYLEKDLSFLRDTGWRRFLEAYPSEVSGTWIGEVRRSFDDTDGILDLRAFNKALMDH